MLNAKQIAWVDVVLVVKDITVIFRKKETIFDFNQFETYFSHPENLNQYLSLPYL